MMAFNEVDRISSPYPGLRPFKNEESAVFFGRGTQIAEIISHLEEHRFVVVLGGSGSGKSSLIKAGVVPGLRSYKIKSAGDVWESIVATPGTDLVKNDLPEDRRRTPIYRLAVKVAASVCLKLSLTTPPTDVLVDEIAELLRRSDGFSRLYQWYVKKLSLGLSEKSGSDANVAAAVSRTNLLIVLDQFEEIFHPSNGKDSGAVEDCRRLVDRVLEHFVDGHPRIYVVLTMRSEYLNRCAEYLQLPDAINKASYLVRRLSPFEIDECIKLPAKHYLAMQINEQVQLRLQNASGDAAELPTSIAFDVQVMKRLREDVEKIKENADHLPLLQHLLARLWESAMRRAQERGHAAPELVDYDDLLWAVTAGSENAREIVESSSNVLILAVQLWAERVWRELGSNQAIVLRLLPLLAFKDPNTGEEVQRRVLVEEAAKSLLGLEMTSDSLNGALMGFMERDYLYWDTEDAAAINVKVSHESFIRGWHRFRDLVTNEADGFNAFLEVLRRHGDWIRSMGSATIPLSRQELGERRHASPMVAGLLYLHGFPRLIRKSTSWILGRSNRNRPFVSKYLIAQLKSHGYDIEKPVEEQPKGLEWKRLLRIKHDGQRWVELLPGVENFGELSVKAIKADDGLRAVVLLSAASAAVAISIFVAMWLNEKSAGVALDGMYTSLMGADALTKERIGVVRSVEDASSVLDLAVNIAKGYETQMSEGSLDIGLLEGPKDRRDRAALMSEQGVNEMLGHAIRKIPMLRVGSALSNENDRRYSVGVERDCNDLRPGSTAGGAAVHGFLIAAVGDSIRRMFVEASPLQTATQSAIAGTVKLNVATVVNDVCTLRRPPFALPRGVGVMVDDRLDYLIYAAPDIVVNRLRWEEPKNDPIPAANFAVDVLFNAVGMEAAKNRPGNEPTTEVRIFRRDAGEDWLKLSLDLKGVGKSVQMTLGNIEAREVQAGSIGKDDEWSTFEAKLKGSACLFSRTGYSLVLAPSAMQVADVKCQSSETVLPTTVYLTRSSLKGTQPQKIGSFSVPNGVALGGDVQWRIGKKGARWEGWVAFRSEDRRWFAAPVGFAARRCLVVNLQAQRDGRSPEPCGDSFTVSLE